MKRCVDGEVWYEEEFPRCRWCGTQLFIGEDSGCGVGGMGVNAEAGIGLGGDVAKTVGVAATEAVSAASSEVVGAAANDDDDVVDVLDVLTSSSREASARLLNAR